ncbi:bifunctional diguanylate cyclase/phosphodiesterase [Noviherbaspirillum massiliense]|uniref:bifunctional diguanylate cyclase/phosphodiesterase n=1 Tax=Noviherbaspirillum massiliense TaxID=1465823 RepID=UPI000314BE5F|nr:diguanylate cyclase [Noviherbaspirillum massiliense]
MFKGIAVAPALKKYVSVLHWFVPERLQHKPLELSRSQNIVSATIIAAISGPFYAFVYHLLGFTPASYVILLCCAVMMSAPFILKATGSIRVAEAVFVSAVFFNFSWLSYHLGGVMAPTAAWLIVCPLVAMLLGGVATGIFWLLMSSCSLITIYLLEVNGFAADPAPIANTLLLQTLCTLGLFMVVAIFALLFEQAKTQGFIKLERALNTIQELAIRDELTGTNNRRHLIKLIEDEKTLANRTGNSFCICLLDIDHFKRINDTYGHSVGDRVLKVFADTVQSKIRAIDCFGRYGGEEFLLMLPQTMLDEAQALAERVRISTEQIDFSEIARNLTVTVSIGISEFRPGDTVSQLIAWADQALYQAKSSGRNRVVLFSDSDTANCHYVVERHHEDPDASTSIPADLDAEGRKLGHAHPLHPHDLQSVLDCIPDSVVLVDKDGECLFANAAARTFIPFVTRQSLNQNQDSYGLFLPDQVTPYPVDMIPLNQALRGQSVDNAEIYVRAPFSAAPVWLSFSAKPLRDNQGNVWGAVGNFREITGQMENKSRRISPAQYDALTGLPNRHIFRDRLSHAMHRSIRSHHMIALMSLDINKFKELNDALGYENGDLALVQVAGRIKDCLRDCDTVSRWDGDAFSIILEDVIDERDACVVAQKIIDALSEPLVLNETECFLSVGIGIILFPVQDIHIDSLLKKADLAMLRAKSSGQNNYEVYSQDMTGMAIERLTLKNQLRRALYRDELFLQYQPQVDIKTNRIIGVEALIRWQHPELGFIAPAQFIPLAEETGLIIPIGEWVLKTACAQMVAWRSEGFSPIKIAVNLSARQLKHPRLVASIREIISETGIDPTYVDLEITEGLLMEDLLFSRKVISELRAIGIKISIDDFGTGYSSLSYLSELPLDILKMDGSFVKRLEDTSHEENSYSIAEAIIAMAHSMNLTVIAEAVETEQQLASLRKMKCDQMQGFLFSRPLASYGVAAMLKRQKLSLTNETNLLHVKESMA